MNDSFVNKIFQKEIPFKQSAFELLSYQYQNNKVYKNWCDKLKVDISSIKSINQIPFLPISFFKTHTVLCGDDNYEILFESSGTTQTPNRSRHYVKDLGLYQRSFTTCFNLFYGAANNWCIIGLLPSYIQQKNSSLIKMVDDLLYQSGYIDGGYYLDNYEALQSMLRLKENQKVNVLVIGVTYALLDFAEHFPTKLTSTTVVMETGGMKGRRKELTRNEVHDVLKKQLSVESVHSEYGMTELLSQAYSKADGRFYCPPWMKVLVRDEDDPFTIRTTGKGILNVIDLANMYSCAFIATDDAGEIFDDGSFSVMGRVDNSDIRGCSLLTV